ERLAERRAAGDGPGESPRAGPRDPAAPAPPRSARRESPGARRAGRPAVARGTPPGSPFPAPEGERHRPVPAGHPGGPAPGSLRGRRARRERSGTVAPAAGGRAGPRSTPRERAPGSPEPRGQEDRIEDLQAGRL